MLFNENGDAPGRYEIYQYQLKNRTAEYKVIGHWADQLHLNVSTGLFIILCAIQLIVFVSVFTVKILLKCLQLFSSMLKLFLKHSIVLSSIFKGVNIQRVL